MIANYDTTMVSMKSASTLRLKYRGTEKYGSSQREVPGQMKRTKQWKRHGDYVDILAPLDL